MSKHFSYLVDDESADFFQKTAFQEAGVAPARAAPPEMSKQAAFTSEFEKVASRLDRDIGIIKSAGQCGLNGGMVKRAAAYLDAVASNSNLSADEFGEIFEKVAGEAIQTDLDYCFEQICQDVPSEYHEEVALGLSKIGFEAAAEATLTKEALLGAARATAKWLSGAASKSVVRGKIGGGAAREVTKEVAKRGGKAALKGAKGVGMVAAAPAYVAGKGAIAAGKGLLSVGRGIASKAKALKGAIGEGIKAGKGEGAALLKAQSAAAKKLAPQTGLKGAVARGGQKSIRKQNLKAFDKGLKKNKVDVPAELQGTTAIGRRSAASSKAATTAEKNQAAIKAETAASEAAAAAKAPKGGVTPKGGDAPKSTAGKPPEAAAPKATVKPAPEGIKPPPEVVENPALMETFNKWTSGGKLTAAEAGKLRGTALKGALGYKLITGKGVVTGGGGLV